MTRHLERIFHAGLTRRWHTNAHLNGTCDRLDGHQARVARIILALWPDASRELLIAAMTHDDGEWITGDIPATFGKTADQASYEAAAYITIWGNKLPRLSEEDWTKLHLADKLDAYKWAQHHAPQIMEDAEWRDAWAQIEAMAAGLGVEAER
jgi:hypothetical protein